MDINDINKQVKLLPRSLRYQLIQAVVAVVGVNALTPDWAWYRCAQIYLQYSDNKATFHLNRRQQLLSLQKTEAELCILCKGEDRGHLQARRLRRTDWANRLGRKENWEGEKSALRENVTADKVFE